MQLMKYRTIFLFYELAHLLQVNKRYNINSENALSACNIYPEIKDENMNLKSFDKSEFDVLKIKKTNPNIKYYTNTGTMESKKIHKIKNSTRNSQRKSEKYENDLDPGIIRFKNENALNLNEANQYLFKFNYKYQLINNQVETIIRKHITQNKEIPKKGKIHLSKQDIIYKIDSLFQYDFDLDDFLITELDNFISIHQNDKSCYNPSDNFYKIENENELTKCTYKKYFLCSSYANSIFKEFENKFISNDFSIKDANDLKNLYNLTTFMVYDLQLMNIKIFESDINAGFLEKKIQFSFNELVDSRDSSGNYILTKDANECIKYIKNNVNNIINMMKKYSYGRKYSIKYVSTFAKMCHVLNKIKIKIKGSLDQHIQFYKEEDVIILDIEEYIFNMFKKIYNEMDVYFYKKEKLDEELCELIESYSFNISNITKIKSDKIKRKLLRIYFTEFYEKEIDYKSLTKTLNFVFTKNQLANISYIMQNLIEKLSIFSTLSSIEIIHKIQMISKIYDELSENFDVLKKIKIKHRNLFLQVISKILKYKIFDTKDIKLDQLHFTIYLNHLKTYSSILKMLFMVEKRIFKMCKSKKCTTKEILERKIERTEKLLDRKNKLVIDSFSLMSVCDFYNDYYTLIRNNIFFMQNNSIEEEKIVFYKYLLCFKSFIDALIQENGCGDHAKENYYKLLNMLEFGTLHQISFYNYILIEEKKDNKNKKLNEIIIIHNKNYESLLQILCSSISLTPTEIYNIYEKLEKSQYLSNFDTKLRGCKDQSFMNPNKIGKEICNFIKNEIESLSVSEINISNSLTITLKTLQNCVKLSKDLLEMYKYCRNYNLLTQNKMNLSLILEYFLYLFKIVSSEKKFNNVEKTNDAVSLYNDENKEKNSKSLPCIRNEIYLKNFWKIFDVDQFIEFNNLVNDFVIHTKDVEIFLKTNKYKKYLCDIYKYQKKLLSNNNSNVEEKPITRYKIINELYNVYKNINKKNILKIMLNKEIKLEECSLSEIKQSQSLIAALYYYRKIILNEDDLFLMISLFSINIKDLMINCNNENIILLEKMDFDFCNISNVLFEKYEQTINIFSKTYNDFFNDILRNITGKALNSNIFLDENKIIETVKKIIQFLINYEQKYKLILVDSLILCVSNSSKFCKFRYMQIFICMEKIIEHCGVMMSRSNSEFVLKLYSYIKEIVTVQYEYKKRKNQFKFAINAMLYLNNKKFYEVLGYLALCENKLRMREKLANGIINLVE